MKSRRSWTEKEDQVFSQLTTEYQLKNWAAISKRMASQFGFKRRTGKQCRQRWYNHLVPGISKKVWTKAEEQRLLQLHKIFGNKWTIISENMTGRTDNSIKNYFYSTVRRSLRRMGKLIGSKNSTNLMREIKPLTLTRIFGVFSEQKDEEVIKILDKQFHSIENLKARCQTVRDDIVQFLSYKPKKQDHVTEVERQRYQNVFNLIHDLSKVYEKIKTQQLRKKSREEILKIGYKQMMKQSSHDEYDDQADSEQIISPSIYCEDIQKHTIFPTAKMPQIVPLQPHANNPIENRDKMNKIDTSQFEEYRKIQMQHIDDDGIQNQISQSNFEDPKFLINLQEEEINLQLNPHNRLNQQSPRFFTPTNQINFFTSPSLAMVSKRHPQSNLYSFIGYQPTIIEEQQNNKMLFANKVQFQNSNSFND